MKLGKLYERLRKVVSDAYTIRISDQIRGLTREGAEVTVQHYQDNYAWTSFQGKTIEEALRRAIAKFDDPAADYIDMNGKVWKATTGSVYGEEYIRSMLRNGDQRPEDG
jgi:hypothetical protein